MHRPSFGSLCTHGQATTGTKSKPDVDTLAMWPNGTWCCLARCGPSPHPAARPGTGNPVGTGTGIGKGGGGIHPGSTGYGVRGGSDGRGDANGAVHSGAGGAKNAGGDDGDGNGDLHRGAGGGKHGSARWYTLNVTAVIDASTGQRVMQARVNGHLVAHGSVDAYCVRATQAI